MDSKYSAYIATTVVAAVVALTLLMVTLIKPSVALAAATLFFGAVAFVASRAAVRADLHYQTNWHSGETVVNKVYIDDDGHDMLCGTDGKMYHWSDRNKHPGFVLGDHVFFEAMPRGTYLTNIPDIRSVKKG
ncbi:hypothetical protein EOL96_02180 [Candidatus Saccharibacteria bacterium]|nr:hypothetical protein [Candidatus Saccharibacteria bacterium]